MSNVAVGWIWLLAIVLGTKSLDQVLCLVPHLQMGTFPEVPVSFWAQGILLLASGVGGWTCCGLSPDSLGEEQVSNMPWGPSVGLCSTAYRSLAWTLGCCRGRVHREVNRWKELIRRRPRQGFPEGWLQQQETKNAERVNKSQHLRNTCVALPYETWVHLADTLSKAKQFCTCLLWSQSQSWVIAHRSVALVTHSWFSNL